MLATRAASKRLGVRFLAAHGLRGQRKDATNFGDDRVSFMFTLEHDRPGALREALELFFRHDVQLTHIESKPVPLGENQIEFFLDAAVDGEEARANLDKCLEHMKSRSEDYSQVLVTGSKEVPWFPRNLEELDSLANNVLEAGADLESDHPGFNDPEYRSRRKEIAQFAADFKLGRPIDYIEYTEAENATWQAVWNQLVPQFRKHGCKEFLESFDLLRERGAYKEDQVPQLRDVSAVLAQESGFMLRPVAGLLSARDFLYGLAFRVFYCTQYIRHSSRPLYTPEPDVVHELMGHAPLFANRDFADFSQCIGLAAIGATDEQILQLARCYWFTVEFGLCRQDNDLKVYGAGILSSPGELEYAMTSDEPERVPWDPFVAAHTDYPITTYQPKYFVADSFADATDRMREFADSFERPFGVSFNPATKTIIVDRNVKLLSREETLQQQADAAKKQLDSQKVE